MKYISALFLVFIIVVIILADMGSLPHSITAIYDFPNGDKLGHFILFGLLDFFLTRAFLPSLPGRSPKLVLSSDIPFFGSASTSKVEMKAPRIVRERSSLHCRKLTAEIMSLSFRLRIPFLTVPPRRWQYRL